MAEKITIDNDALDEVSGGGASGGIIKALDDFDVCTICGYLYNPAEHGGVAFKDLPEDWKCPRCKQGKDKFEKA